LFSYIQVLLGNLHQHGKLFDVFQYTANPFHLDHIIFHQCGDPNHIGRFFKFIWEFVGQAGIERGFIDNKTNFFDTSSFPARISCMDSVEVSHSLWWIEGKTGKIFTRELMAYLGRILPETIKSEVLSRQKRYGPMPGDADNPGRACERCMSKLRLSLYERSAKDQARRLLTNKQDIFDLFHEITSNVGIISVSSNNSIEDVYDAFNTYDILATPHGSHMLNVFFTNSSNYALIEVTGAELFDKADDVRHWTSIVPYYDVTFPHASTDNEIQKIIDTSPSVVGDLQAQTRIKQSDLIVNITRLRDSLHGAINHLCNCSLPVCSQ